MDYRAIIRQYDVVQRVESGEIDEVWLFGFPYAGFYESIMVGRGLLATLAGIGVDGYGFGVFSVISSAYEYREKSKEEILKLILKRSHH